MCEGNQLYPAFGKQLSNWRFYQKNKGQQFKPNLITFILEFEDIDVRAAKQAFKALVDGHESLRTTFVQTGEGVMQVISPFKQDAYNLWVIDCIDHRSYEQKRRLYNARIERMLKELETGPLFTGILYKVAKEGFYLELFIHHIIADAWSVRLIENELLGAYEAISSNRPAAVNLTDAQLKQYALEYHAQQAEEKAKQYWTKKLEDLPAGVDWQKLYATYNAVVNTGATRSVYKPRLSVNSNNLERLLNLGYGHTYSVMVGEKTTEKISRLSARYKTTPSIIVLVSFLVLLRFLFDTDRTLIISRLNGRFDPFNHKMIGNFTCATYSSIKSDKTAGVEQLVDTLFRDFLHAISYAVYNPLIVSNIPLTVNCHLCVNILYDEHEGTVNENNEINKTVMPTYFPIENIVRFFEKKIVFNWIYNTSLFRDNIIQFVAREHMKVLDKMTSHAME